MNGVSARMARKGDMCDTHLDVPAAMRVTGVDTYTNEPVNCCQPCYDKLKIKLDKQRERPCMCDWCHQKKLGVKPFKDREGNRDNITSNVCEECRKAYVQKELTNDFIAGRRRTRTIKEQEEALVSEEAGVDNNDDELSDED